MQRLLVSALGIVLCWALGALVVSVYAEHLLLADRGWQIHYVTLITGVAALLSLCLAAIIWWLLPLLFKRRRRPGFALLACLSFAAILTLSMVDEYRRIAARETGVQQSQQWESDPVYQACVAQGMQQSLLIQRVRDRCRAAWEKQEAR